MFNINTNKMKDTYEGLGGFHDDSYNQVRTFDDLVLRIDTIFDDQKSGTSYFDYQLRFLLKLIINYSRHRDGKTTADLVEIDKALEFLNISQGDSQSVVNQGIDKLIKYLYGSKVVFITSEVNTIPLTPGKEDNYYWNKANNNLYLYRNGRYINMGGYKPNTIYIKLFENEKHLYIRDTDATLENVSEKFIKVETVLGINPDANKNISFKLSDIENDTNFVTIGEVIDTLYSYDESIIIDSDGNLEVNGTSFRENFPIVLTIDQDETIITTTINYYSFDMVTVNGLVIRRVDYQVLDTNKIKVYNLQEYKKVGSNAIDISIFGSHLAQNN